MKILIFLPFLLSALEIDEKLPVRILRTSDSKKTVLVNRGIEDGLVVGDHAKFILTTGVIGRGVVLKASPTRSVWAIYRMVQKKELEKDAVMNIKISAKEKLTSDITQMIKQSEGPKPNPKEQLIEKSLSSGDLSQDEVADLHKIQSSDGVDSYVTTKTWEVWSMLYWNALSSTNSTGSQSQGTSGDNQSLDFVLGLEKYFIDYEKWFGSLSIYPLFHYSRQSTTNVQGNKVSSSTFSYGAGLSWHFSAPPLSVEKTIYYLTFSFGLGNASDEAVLSSSNTSLGNIEGTASFFSLGLGLKYYIGRGFGLRALLDYYQRTEKYEFSESDSNFSKLSRGPRILLGLSYRF